jgi:hypothetical protein
MTLKVEGGEFMEVDEGEGKLMKVKHRGLCDEAGFSR